jgi:endonuclease/exonuclease/phosphatase family metal-dependent hydrolase
MLTGEAPLIVASWNLNHRVGKTRYRPEAIDAAMALNADAIFFNEYFPRQHHEDVARRLTLGGWTHQLISSQTTDIANRVFVASRIRVEVDESIPLADFDQQMSPNSLCVSFPETGLRVLAIRVPYYTGKDRPLTKVAWDWIERTAGALVGAPAIIVGDLNVEVNSPPRMGGTHFRRMLESGWSLATPTDEPSYFSSQGARSTLDHLLHSSAVMVSDASFVTAAGDWHLAGQKDALSDHAAVVAQIDF